MSSNPTQLEDEPAVSNCCSAKVWNPGNNDTGICEQCEEHCVEVRLTNEGDEWVKKGYWEAKKQQWLKVGENRAYSKARDAIDGLRYINVYDPSAEHIAHNQLLDRVKELLINLNVYGEADPKKGSND
jgi:hypothetical protein